MIPQIMAMRKHAVTSHLLIGNRVYCSHAYVQSAFEAQMGLPGLYLAL